MAPTKQHPKLKRLIKEIELWVASPANQSRPKTFGRMLTEGVKKGSKGGVASAGSALRVLGHYHQMLGQSAVLNGDIEGWRAIDRALSCRLLAGSITVPWPQSSSCLLAMSFGLGRASLGDRLGLSVMSHPDAINVRRWDLRDFPLFAFRTWKTIGSHDADLPPLPEDNAYRELDEQLLSTASVDALLEQAAERHVVEAAGPDEADFHDISLLPCEILWLQNIRRERGLPVGELMHPLMHTPLARPPAPADFPRFSIDDAPEYLQVREAAMREGLLEGWVDV